MDPLTVMLAASLLMAPASNGNLVLKDVSSWSVDMDWTEVLPGFEMMMEGTYHNVTFLFSTPDAAVFRLVELSDFHGVVGARTHDPLLGEISLITEYKLLHTRFVGDVSLNQVGAAVPEDGILAVRMVGSLTLTADGITLTGSENALVFMQVTGGTIEWVRIGVPMGWPFQVLSA